MTLLRRATNSFRGAPARLPMNGGGGLFGGVNSQTSNSQGAAFAAYGSVGTLFAVVNRIAESVALVDWTLYQQSKSGDRTEVDDATAPANHPATAIWTHPNPYQTRQELVQTTQQHLDLAGESYWVINDSGNDRDWPMPGADSPLEMWPIRPDKMRRVPSPDGGIAGYQYLTGNTAGAIPIERKYVVHLRVPSPTDPLGGMGPVQALMTDLDAERYASQYNRTFFLNNAEPGGIIQFDTPLSDVDFERLVTRWREQHQGVANAFRVAILERGTWVDRKYSMRDMAWQQLRHVNRDLIMLAFGIHAAVMGISEGVNRANAEAAEVGFSRWVLRPRLERIKHALNEHVMPFFGPDLTMDYIDPTPSDQAQLINQNVSLYLSGLGGWSECRQNVGLSAELEPNDHLLPTPPPPLTAPPKVPTMLGFEGTTKALPSVLRDAEATMEQAWRKRMMEMGEAYMDELGVQV